MKKLLCSVLIAFTVASAAHACLDKNGRPIPGMICIGGKMTEAKEVRASHILVDSEEQAIELKGRIEAGESFADLAKKHSECPSGKKGGDLGYFTKGMMVKEFEGLAFTLPVGQVSEPVKTQFGWHLIQVTDRR